MYISPSPLPHTHAPTQTYIHRPNLSHNQSSTFHQPTAYTTASLLALDPRTTPGGIAISPHTAAAPVGTKLSLLQPTEFGNTNPPQNLAAVALPHPSLQTQQQQQQQQMGGGSGNRRALKRSHEESLQQEGNSGGISLLK